MMLINYLYLLITQELFYDNRHYHETCFRCFRCDRSLADEPFTNQDDGLVCSDCYCNEFSAKCAACDKTVMPGGWHVGDMWVTAPLCVTNSQWGRHHEVHTLSVKRRRGSLVSVVSGDSWCETMIVSSFSCKYLVPVHQHFSDPSSRFVHLC